MKIVRCLGAVVAAFAIMLQLLVPHVSAATVPTKTALVYGDSITYESIGPLAQQFATKKGWNPIRVHSYGGTAPCDWLGWLAADLANVHPTTVAIETAGNSATNCMRDTNGVLLAQNSPEYLAKYRADLDAMFAQIKATGAKIVFVKAPPMGIASVNTAVNNVSDIATQLAANYHGISISSSPRNAVSASGKYVEYKACLATETAEMGCLNKKIAIRAITNLDKGIHLCPVGLVGSPTPGFCPVYSSGEYRFGKAMANTIASPPAPILP